MKAWMQRWVWECLAGQGAGRKQDTAVLRLHFTVLIRHLTN